MGSPNGVDGIVHIKQKCKCPLNGRLKWFLLGFIPACVSGEGGEKGACFVFLGHLL